MHHHRHNVSGTAAPAEPRPFFCCVRPDACDPRAHGGYVRREGCACGAARDVAVNGHHLERGPWHEARPLACPVCGERAVAHAFPREGWALQVSPGRLMHAHESDGSPLCAVLTTGGYQPAYPVSTPAGWAEIRRADTDPRYRPR